jgi:hypothetical protein
MTPWLEQVVMLFSNAFVFESCETGTRDSTLIDVICTSTASQLAATKAAYAGMFHSDLVTA